MVTKYNIAFNGNESYKEGIKSIISTNQDDYSTIIPMYPVSRHSNAKSATSQMDKSIEKSRKAIKLHSIKTKPKRNAKKSGDPEYQAFYNQKEFNPALKDAWMTIAKSEFHKGDFLGAVGTFSYISKFYVTDKDLVAQCQLWTVWAYVEMDWLYEAEELLQKINQDDLKRSNIGLLSSVTSVLLLKKKQYKEAIPFVEMALARERSKAMKQRFTFLLAQLYQNEKDNQSAIKYYTSVIKMNPPYVMDFNARINRAQLSSGSDLKGILKEFKKMLKNPNNKEYLDQLYYAIGNAYMMNGDTLKAIENYNLSVESSTRNGVEKAISLITLGDLYYAKKQYVKAEPSYSEAAKIITNDHSDYIRVSKLSEVLGELTAQHSIVVLQDSLQHLSTLSEDQRMEVAKNIIASLEAEEKRAAEKTAELARAGEDTPFVPIGGLNDDNSAKWYFYNTNLIKSGKADFQRRWGSRKLEDNWRRTSRSTSMFGDNTMTQTDGDNIETGEGVVDGAAPDKKAEILDNKNPEFYLRQIPVTPEQIKKSDAQIADALFEMGMIYKDKINDLPMAIDTYNDFIRRFGKDARISDAYFQLYLTETKQKNELEANNYRNKIIRDYPDTKYAQILSQPDYVERFNLMQKQQDSLYSATYQAYSMNNFRAVANNVGFARDNYPLSKLMPKFMFLEALSIGKTDTPERFEQALNKLVEAYPQSDVSAMAKDIAALIRQGKEAQTGTSHGSLLTRREDELKAEIQQKSQEEGVAMGNAYSFDKQSKHRLLLISSAEQQQVYQLMYQVAAFNFTRFMIKEFDLVLSQLDEKRQLLSVTNFESYDETIWYQNSINSDLTIGQFIDDLKIQEVIISEDNFALLKKLGFDEYLAFQAKELSGEPKKTTQKPTVKPTKPQSKPVVSEQLKPEPKPQVVAPKPETKVEPKLEPTPVKSEDTSVVTVDNVEVTETEMPKVTQEEKKEDTIQSEQPVQKENVVEELPVPQLVQEPEEVVPLYKGLFGYQPDKTHFVALYVISGKLNFDKIKSDFDTYNAENYSMLNLNISLETVGSQQVIIIGSFSDANIAKSYLLRIVKEKTVLEGLKGTNYRNLLGTQKNLNVMMQNNALKTYSEFMQEYYFK